MKNIKRIITALITILILSGCSNKTSASILFEANASIEVIVDADCNIISISSNNTEGEQLIQNLNLINTSLEKASTLIIEALIENNYVNESENSVLISIYSSKDNLEELIEHKLEKTLPAYDFTLDCAIYIQEYEKDIKTTNYVHKYDISYGKAELMEEILEDHNNYTKDLLAKLSIHELLLLTNDTTDMIHSGEISTQNYISKEEALNLVLHELSTNKESLSNLSIEYDFEDKNLTYDIEFNYNNQKYEYEINARDGSKVKEEITSASLSKEEALTIALKDANLKEEEIYDIEVEMENKGSKLMYEIDFESITHEYEYRINAETKEIVRKSIEKR